MANYILNGICSIFSSVRETFWAQSESLKRRRCFSEDEEIPDEYQTLSKRIRCTNGDGTASRNDIICISKKNSTIRSQKRVDKRLYNIAAKENRTDHVEVIEIEDDEKAELLKRPPLSSLSNKMRTLTKNKKDCGVVYSLNGSQNHMYHKYNGCSVGRTRSRDHQQFLTPTLTTSLRMLKDPSPKQTTALEETLGMDDKKIYSSLLGQFSKKPMNKMIQHEWQYEHPLSKEASHSYKPPTQNSPKPIKIHVKALQSSAPNDDVVIIEERSFPPVNSLEKKLSQNALFSDEWMKNLAHRFAEKQRQTQRQVEEAKICVELCSKHNEANWELAERVRKHLQITDVVLDDSDTILPELTEDMNKEIDAAFNLHPHCRGTAKPKDIHQVLVTGFGQMIRRHDIVTLNSLNWLNDEVINFYMNLIMERSKEGKYKKVYAFNTFFYPKLISQGYQSLKRWTRKVDVFEHELLLVPIHLGLHWCLATVDFGERTVQYYDSMGSDNNKCLNALLKYINEESLDKKKTPYDTSKWTSENMKDIPQQMNGSDCGMFCCMFSEYLSRNAKFSFSQRDMPYFRRKMVYEIIKKTLLL